MKRIGKPTTVGDIIALWKEEFIKNAKINSRSTKRNFGFEDAKNCSKEQRTAFDETLINFHDFIEDHPLKKNDYYKYVNAYRAGKKLNNKYFRHDLKKLNEYYKKVNADKEYNPFNFNRYRNYVLYMMLKLSGNYLLEYDEVFKVKTVKNREYNPLTAIPSVLRNELPIKIKEFDIVQAYPNFIFEQLQMAAFDVYSKIEKRKFNTLLNSHKEVKGMSINKVRQQLSPIYGKRVNEVITEERYNNKGKLYEDLSKMEADYIAQFVKANQLMQYVRLHDGVVTTAEQHCENRKFDNIEFKVKKIDRVISSNTDINFYDFQKNKILTSPAMYSRFFQQEGFIRITRQDYDQITVLKNNNRIVKPINHKTDLVAFLKVHINEVETHLVEDRIAFDANTKIQQGLLLLSSIPFKLHSDTKTQADYPFKNGIARVTTEKIELVGYDQIDGFFTEHSTQKHDISFCDVEKEQSDFFYFLGMIATGKDVLATELSEEDNHRILAFCTMFGYCITNYKDPAFCPAIILSDFGADGINRNGGRGKSLVQTALGYFRKEIYKGGNSYDPNYTHVHADLHSEHDIYLIDDAPANFDYNALYTNITGSITAQRKGSAAEVIPFGDAPKFVVSTNWVFRYDDEAASTNRRFREFQFSDFFNITNTPEKVFGKTFFTDWTENEWNTFYNFGFHCVQMYLKFGLLEIQYDKKLDNFRAHFHNDGILDEMTRIMKILSDRPDFSVTEFIEIHKSKEIYYHKPEFNIRNARQKINSFIGYNKLPFVFIQKERRWKALS